MATEAFTWTERVWHWLCLLRYLWHPWARLGFCWIVALCMCGGTLYLPTTWFPTWVTEFLHLREGGAWNGFERKNHPLGNVGHTTIDFGGQYLMARMMITGHGRDLYHRKVQRPVLAEAYGCPCRADFRAYKDEDRTDAEKLLQATIDDGDDSAEGKERERGGALYPPVHALLYAPLGLLEPMPAYRTLQVLHIVVTILLGCVVQIGTRGRVWAPVAIGFILCYPGYKGSIDLGQNSLFTLFLLGTGWCCLARGRPLLGGVFWGLLAFKPVWAVSFLLVPLLTGRWRFLLSMCVTGAVLVLLTLPFVGIEVWFDWLAVGKAADKIYVTDENWVHLSRDLQGLVRRMLATWDSGITYRWNEDWYVWAGPLPFFQVLGVTLVLGLLMGLRRWRQLRRLRALGLTAEPERTGGPGAAFLLLGSWLACWHFMYYDLLASALGVGVLFAAPGRYFRPSFVARADHALPEDLKRFHGLSVLAPTVLAPGAWRTRWVNNPFSWVLLVGVLLIWPVGTLVYDPEGRWRAPIDTWLLLFLWVWSGWMWIRNPNYLAEPGVALVPPGEQDDPEKDEPEQLAVETSVQAVGDDRVETGASAGTGAWEEDISDSADS